MLKDNLGNYSKMNKNKKFYPGRHLFSSQNIVKKSLTFEQLNTKIQQKYFIKPSFQGALEEKRVEEMKSRYKAHPEFFQYKNTVVIGHVNDKLYIIDGQHRMEMACELASTYPNELLIIAYYTLKSIY